MHIDLIKAEICILNNYNYDCLEFKSYAESNSELIKAVKGVEKYRLNE